MRRGSVVVLISLFMGACSSVSKPSSNLKSFENIEIGSPAAKIIDSFGKPKKNTEQFQSIRFDVYEYFTMSGQPAAFFTIDSQQRVVGRSIWVEASDKKSPLNEWLNNEFRDIKFKRYIPCETWGDDVVLINRDLGIMIAARDQNVQLISKSQQPLTDLRIGQFYKKCPQLQSE